MAQGLSRLEIQTLLENITGSDNIYFQPKENIEMEFPCIVYARDYAYKETADNVSYYYCLRYSVTIISRDPDIDWNDKIAALPMSSFTRFFVADNLNHDVFNVYF